MSDLPKLKEVLSYQKTVEASNTIYDLQEVASKDDPKQDKKELSGQIKQDKKLS